MMMKRSHTLLRVIFMSPVWLFFMDAGAQKITQFEGYFNYTDHRCMLFNSDKTCDSLNLRDFQNKKPDPELLVCYVQDYEGNPIMLYEKAGVAIYIDSNGALYSQNNYALVPKPYHLNLNIDQLLRGRRDMVIETDDSDYDSLVIRAVPLNEYRLGRINKKGATQIALYYDNFTYPAMGELSPTILNKLQDGIKIYPEDGKVEDKITIYIPMEMVNVPGSFSLYVFDLRGNILRMFTNLDQNENILHRENLMSGTYRYAIYFGPSKVEVKKGMLNFKEIARPE
ncbi:MAG TPA: hypothetical protein DIW47_08490 [Bacteroidetes bacterium]|nr:hypothetical protein [Bacteroidota bacterium]